MAYCIFPGSFDPVTLGHEDIIKRISGLFDRVTVAILNNSSKKCMFSIEQRMNFLKSVCVLYTNVEVISYNGLLAQYAKEINCRVIVRGLRNIRDYDYETELALCNKRLNNGLETFFITANGGLRDVSSMAVREILAFNGDVTGFVSENIKKQIYGGERNVK